MTAATFSNGNPGPASTLARTAELFKHRHMFEPDATYQIDPFGDYIVVDGMLLPAERHAPCCGTVWWATVADDV